LAPGIEGKHDRREDLIRIGAGCEFESGTAKVTPVLAIDFVGRETIYFLSIGLGFDF